MNQIFCVIFFVFGFYSNSFPQIWKSYTPLNDARAIVKINNLIWVATSGGVYNLNELDSTVAKFTNAEGLSSNDATSIGSDKFGNIWVGFSNGMINIYLNETKSWLPIKDIYLSQKTQKTINKFFNRGDTIFIATGFGVSLYSISRKEFLDTYNNFGVFGQQNVYDVNIFNDRIVVATELGVAISKTNATNFSAPDSWQTTEGKTTSLAIFNNKLFAATTTGVFIFENNKWSKVSGLEQNTLKLVSAENGIYAIEQSEVKFYNSQGVVSKFGTSFTNIVTDAIITDQNKLLITFQNKGIGQFQNSNWNFYSPNGPASNYFSSVAIDNNGEIWAASGRQNGHGFYRFTGTYWQNYNSFTDPILKINDYFKIIVTPTNEKLVSSWGNGIALLNKEGKVLRMFNNSSPGFVGVESANFVVSAGASFDSENNLWVTIYKSGSLDILWKMKPDSQWTQYKASQNFNYTTVLDLFVDQNGTKWFTNTMPGFNPPASCVYFNEKTNIAGTSDNWGILTESNGLTSLQITSIAGGTDGDIWIGTTSGITIINDPANPTKNISKVYLGALREQMIQCIAVDGVNNKWIGTPQGIYCVSPDGSSLISHYNTTTTNGKLVSNNILSIAVDKKNGVVYAGTDKGLSSFTIQYVSPTEKMEKLSISPQPFFIPSEKSITISGLLQNSIIKILTSTGTIVNEFDAQGGGRGFWDGKDKKGSYVSSGIYIAVAYNQLGNEIGLAKIAIIRQ